MAAASLGSAGTGQAPGPGHHHRVRVRIWHRRRHRPKYFRCAGRNRPKTIIDPVDDFTARAEVACELMRFQGLVANAQRAGAHEQADLRLAKNDRSIASDRRPENRLRASSGCQPPTSFFQQLVLGPVGVLVFIDQDMANALVQVQGQIGVAASWSPQARVARRRPDRRSRSGRRWQRTSSSSAGRTFQAPAPGAASAAHSSSR